MIEIDNALEVGLEAQAGTIRPRPDLADVFVRIEHRQRRTRLTGVGTCVLLVVGAIIGALVVRHGDQQPATNSPVAAKRSRTLRINSRSGVPKVTRLLERTPRDRVG